MYGRYLETQMPFIGINDVFWLSNRVDIARVDLCINLFKQHYLTLTGNYMFEWDPGRLDIGYTGVGAAYAINTIVGPIQFLAHWSTLSHKPGFYFSLGYDF